MTELPGEDEIRDRRAGILVRIARAAERARRNPADVALMAVSKTHPAETVAAAARAGQTLFGENRVAEGIAKIGAVRDRFPDLDWRLIGPLQTNKAAGALQWFAMVETVDRERLAARLEGLLPVDSRPYPVLIEVNVAGETSKAGASPEEVETLTAAVLARGRLDLRGFMTVPPFENDPEAARPHFWKLKEIRDRMGDRFGRPFLELSMGMSHDFEIAIEEGSMEVRIGTSLFGSRAQ